MKRAYEPQTKFTVLFVKTAGRVNEVVKVDQAETLREINDKKNALFGEATAAGANRFIIASTLQNYDQQTGRVNRVTPLRTYQDEHYGS